MGSGFSRCIGSMEPDDIKIHDFNMVNIPNGYTLIKIATYNINIRNTVNLSNRVRDIIDYLTSSYKNKSIDILCLQGIHDYQSAHRLVKEIKKYGREQRKTYFFAPDFENINSRSDTENISRFHSSFPPQRNQLSQQTSSLRQMQSRKAEVQNIIISEFPIVTSIYAEIDDNLDIDDIIGTQSVIGANISIYGNVISVYNTALGRDIKSANLINRDTRTKEIHAIFDTILENKLSLNSDAFAGYLKTDVHFLTGSLNIPETYRGDMNDEFVELVQNYHCIDPYRNITDDPGHTTSSKERMDYIMFLLDDQSFEPIDPYYNLMEAVETTDDLLSYIFKKYKIYFLDTSVVSDNQTNNSTSSFPVESVFMFYRNKH